MGQRRGSRYVRSWKDQIAIFVAACMLTHRVGNCMHGPSRPRGVDTAICINVILYFFCLTFCCRPPSHERGSGSLLQTPRPSAAPCQNRDPRSSPTGEATCKRGLRPPPTPRGNIVGGSWSRDRDVWSFRQTSFRAFENDDFLVEPLGTSCVLCLPARCADGFGSHDIVT